MCGIAGVIHRDKSTNVGGEMQKMEKDELSLPKSKKINWITGLRL